MAQDDRDPERPTDDEQAAMDPDRAAILARRQRFIAIALSGLAAAACDACKPQPCLNVAEPVQQPDDPKTSPQPCLEVAPPQEPPAPDDTGATPQPCLKIAQPQPCLDVAAPPEEPTPQPCLRVAPPDPKPQPKPQPCLKVAPKGG